MYKVLCTENNKQTYNVKIKHSKKDRRHGTFIHFMYRAEFLLAKASTSSTVQIKTKLGKTGLYTVHCTAYSVKLRAYSEKHTVNNI